MKLKTVKRTDKAVASLFFQDLADVAHTADRELIIVELVSWCSSCIHDIIALLLLVLALGFSWGAFRSWVVRGAKVVSYFMCKRDMGDFWRYVGGIVLYSDYTSVERLLFSVRVQLAFFTDASGAPWEWKAQAGTNLPNQSYKKLRIVLIKEGGSDYCHDNVSINVHMT